MRADGKTNEKTTRWNLHIRLHKNILISVIDFNQRIFIDKFEWINQRHFESLRSLVGLSSNEAKVNRSPGRLWWGHRITRLVENVENHLSNAQGDLRQNLRFMLLIRECLNGRIVPAATTVKLRWIINGIQPDSLVHTERGKTTWIFLCHAQNAIFLFKNHHYISRSHWNCRKYMRFRTVISHREKKMPLKSHWNSAACKRQLSKVSEKQMKTDKFFWIVSQRQRT